MIMNLLYNVRKLKEIGYELGLEFFKLGIWGLLMWDTGIVLKFCEFDFG